MNEDEIIVSFPLKIPEITNIETCEGQLEFLSQLYDEFMSSLDNVFSQKFGGGKKRNNYRRKRQTNGRKKRKYAKCRKTKKRGGSFTRNQANTLLKIIFAYFYFKTLDLWKLPLDVMTINDVESENDEEKLRLQQLILYRKERRDFLRGDEVTGWAISEKPKTTSEIINHIKQFSEFKFILKNQFGTCSLITNMFLNTIKLFEFEKIYKEIQKDEIFGVSEIFQQSIDYITKNLNRKLRNKNDAEIMSSWTILNAKPIVPYKQVLKNVENFENNIMNIDPTLILIQEMKTKLIRLRQKLYGTTKNKNVVTAFVTKKHIAVIWLMEDDNIVIIDAEMFLKYRTICLFVENREKFKRHNNTFLLKPLREYIKKQISFEDENEEICIFNEALTTFRTSPLSDLEHPAFDLTKSSIFDEYKNVVEAKEKAAQNLK